MTTSGMAVPSATSTKTAHIGSERILGIPEICEATGLAKVSAASIIKESGKGFRLHHRLYMLESSFYEFLRDLEGEVA